MSFLCCGVKYSKKDPETFYCIETDIIRNFTRTKIGENKVTKQVIETLYCKKNGCVKLHNKFFGRCKNGKIKILSVERLNGEAAIQFLKNTEAIRIRQPQKEPVISVPQAKKITICYGKVIDSVTQRARYINEMGWGHNSENIHSECVTVSDENLLLIKQSK